MHVQDRSIELIDKALSRVVDVPGNLNGQFHLLSTVFKFYYGYMLQAFQTALGWKKIQGNKISKTYQQACMLAIQVHRALEERLFGKFSKKHVQTDENTHY